MDSGGRQMTDMSPFARKVHRSLLPRDMLGGVPAAGLVLLLIMTVFFLYVFRWIWMIVPIVLFYFVMRYMTKQDEWQIDIILENIQEKDVYIP
jgi:type IV secretory pathway VirB3-like protein